jgi:hypothetical protein
MYKSIVMADYKTWFSHTKHIKSSLQLYHIKPNKKAIETLLLIKNNIKDTIM